ncbi:hypothetical protein C3I41_01730 [Campylobacter jejuni]|nr:hypothetical protein [Campylobacter jejuni]KQI35497.1 hypothetical protein Y868_07660 [Campylobacter jejuni CVM 41918]EAH4793744.1 hypothetical protein [Campylobacter jejuni]EAH5991696.1 hypothetical protein [Campylobacter jejuni]EAH6606760.1 hypothetical protein [Campylobacter jejuni]
MLKNLIFNILPKLFFSKIVKNLCEFYVNFKTILQKIKVLYFAYNFFNFFKYFMLFFDFL